MLTVSGWFGWQQVKPVKTRQILVLVTQFEGPELENYFVTDTIVENLEEATESYPRVKIKELDKVVKNSEQARQLGEEKQASIVIWGKYGKTKEVVPISVNFEVMKSPEYYPTLPAETRGKVQTMPITELESFTLQTRLSQEMAYLTLFTLGMINYEAEAWEQAISYFTDSLEQIDQYSSFLDLEFVYFYRGNSYHSKREYNLAIADYNQAIQLNPNYAKAYYNRGSAYSYKREYDLAIANYNQAIQLNPNLAEAYNGRGNVYANKKEYNLAIADYNQAIQLNPNLDKSYYNRGSIYNKKGEYNLAIADYNQAIQLNPALIEAYYNRGVVYSDKEEYDLAIADYTQVIKLNPNYAIAYNNRGIIYADKEEYDLAIADYNQVLTLNPNYTKVYYNLGIAYKNKGDQNNAINNFKKVLALNNDPELRKKAEYQLKELEK